MDWRRVLKALVAELPPSVCIGVGTVMDKDVALLPEIAAMGADGKKRRSVFQCLPSFADHKLLHNLPRISRRRTLCALAH